MDHRIILPGVRTVQQFHLDVHSLVRLVFHSLAVDNGDIKDSGIGKAGGVQQDRGPAKIHLILLAAQLPGLQLRPGGDAAGPVVSNRNFICLAVGGVYGLLQNGGDRIGREAGSIKFDPVRIRSDRTHQLGFAPVVRQVVDVQFLFHALEGVTAQVHLHLLVCGLPGLAFADLVAVGVNLDVPGRQDFLAVDLDRGGCRYHDRVLRHLACQEQVVVCPKRVSGQIGFLLLGGISPIRALHGKPDYGDPGGSLCGKQELQPVAHGEVFFEHLTRFFPVKGHKGKALSFAEFRQSRDFRQERQRSFFLQLVDRPGLQHADVFARLRLCFSGSRHLVFRRVSVDFHDRVCPAGLIMEISAVVPFFVLIRSLIGQFC